VPDTARHERAQAHRVDGEEAVAGKDGPMSGEVSSTSRSAARSPITAHGASASASVWASTACAHRSAAVPLLALRGHPQALTRTGGVEHEP